MNSNDQTTAADSAGMLDMTQCPYWGQGGQYLCDPVTGKRTRVEAAAATDSMPAQPAAQANVDMVADINNQSKKEKARA